MGTLIPYLVTTAIGLAISIIGYFVKRTMDDIKNVREDYTPKSMHQKDFDECRQDIKQIKEDYITKEDFFREQTKTDRKLDRIMDILLEMKGDKKS